MIKSKSSGQITLSFLFSLSFFRFLHDEPERLDYTIKKCKRLTTMLYQLKRLAINQEQKPVSVKTQRQFSFGSNGKSVDRKRLLKQIESVTQNSDGRLKAIEVSVQFILDQRRKYLFFFFFGLEIWKTTRMSSVLCKSIRYIETHEIHLWAGMKFLIY